jgi:acetyl-CoA C-acetyltransferase
MIEVVIAGIGQTEVAEHWEISLRDLAYLAIRDAIKDAGGLTPQALFAGNMLAPNLSNQAHLGVLLADFAGLPGIEAVTVEAAGASGGAALRQGYLAVASGMVDVALVVGVEKFTDTLGSGVEDALATTGDSDFEAVHGMTTGAQAALIMRRYMHEFDVPADGFAGFPLTAVILSRRELLPGGSSSPRIKISGSAACSDTLALHDRHDVLGFDSAKLSVEKALKKAGIDLTDIDFFEYHDIFSIYAALSLEAAGFASRGQGWKMASDGSISRTGRIPCATMGGLKARGFPGGATGVYQAVEGVTQLRGTADSSIQINGARFGLIQSLGGPAATAVTHILERI